MSLFVSIALQAAMVATPKPVGDIVVEGRRLDDAYRACVAGRCSVLRDAQVSIALAEQQIRGGAYADAKRTMAASVSRNKTKAASDPKPVAAIYEAYATVALQDGDLEKYRRGVSGQVRTLSNHLPEGDPARRDAPLAVGDMWVKLGHTQNAMSTYTAAEQDAQRAGDVRGALMARMRRIGLAAALEDLPQARRLLREAAAGPAASDPAFRPVLKVMALRLAARGANDATLDRIVREIGHATESAPALIWEPRYAPSGETAARDHARQFGSPDPTAPASSDAGVIQWADIGFWIAPDGRTREAEVLRGEGGRGWIEPVLRQIAGRRYTGAADTMGAERSGVYRVERFTNRGTTVTPKGSLIRRRASPRKLEMLDLTAPSAAPTTPK